MKYEVYHVDQIFLIVYLCSARTILWVGNPFTHNNISQGTPRAVTAFQHQAYLTARL